MRFALKIGSSKKTGWLKAAAFMVVLGMLLAGFQAEEASDRIVGRQHLDAGLAVYQQTGGGRCLRGDATGLPGHKVAG